MLKLRFDRFSAVVVALALIVAAFAFPTAPARAGDDHYKGGGNRGSSGVNIGIGVGTILLNEAIRRRQQQQEQNHATQPKGCPDGYTWSKKKRDCIKLASPCEPPKIKTKKGCIYPDTKTVTCKWPEVKAGKGCGCAAGYYREHDECVKKNTDTVSCEFPEVKSGRGCDCAPGYYREHNECVKKQDVVTCYFPKIRMGDACACAPGFVPTGGTCTKVVVVEPVPDEPDEPPYVEPITPRPPKQVEQPKPKPKDTPKLAAVEPVVDRCLPQDLYDLMVETYGKRPGVGPCPTACLPKPVDFTPARLDAIASREGITWCENCLQVGPYMPLASIQRLEALGGLTICVAPDACVYPGGGAAGGVRTEIRTVFKNLPAGVKNEDNLAVVVGNQDYADGIPDNAYGDSDADAVTALLIDQLGYRKENIIDLRDANLADLERVFGSEQNPGGEIAKRIDKQDPGDVFIYVASHGMAKEEDTKQVYLLPVDAKLDQLDTTAYPLQELYHNLGKTGARTTMLVLEANFAKNLDELIDPPNLPELDVEAMPLTPVAGLAVFKASDRDQRTIQDPEYGIGLFTRYLIEGLAGRADEAPLGNGDRRIDTVELYVYTADTVRNAARKSFGMEQTPMLSKIDNRVVGNLASK
jgi:hypothetical protein